MENNSKADENKDLNKTVNQPNNDPETISFKSKDAHESFQLRHHIIENCFNSENIGSSLTTDMSNAASSEVRIPNKEMYKYNIEHVADCVNPNQQKLETDLELDFLSKDKNDIKEITPNADEIETKFAMLNKYKEMYFNILKSMKPSDIIIGNRKHIEKICNNCIAQHLEKINTAKSVTSQNKSHASIFELHVKNLSMQQKEFDTCVTDLKQKLNYVYDDNAEAVVKKTDEIKMLVEKECNLFGMTFPAYAYKTDILNAIKENQLVLISSDNSYFFNIVVPAIIKAKIPDYLVISCESNYLSINYLKAFIGQNTKLNISEAVFMTEEEILKFLCKKFPVESKIIVIFNLPLKRTIISDLLLAVLRDFLHKNRDSRLILLISAFDDIIKYQKYFSILRLALFRVPHLVFPIEIVWKKESAVNLENYIEDVVSTALSVHIVNNFGDALVFMASDADAEIAATMLSKKLRELNYDNVECILLHKNSSYHSFCPTKCHSKHKRVFFFTTCIAELIPIRSVRYVIDSGLNQCYIFDNKKNLNIMTTVYNSHARAKLRESIVGIYPTGICYRIYSKEIFCNGMQSFECPDIVNLNPLNTFVTLFHYQPENALSIQFVEPLDNAVKNNTIKQLKNFNIINNGKLTRLGKNMGKLLLPVRYSKLILQGIQWDFAYEAVILVAYFFVNPNVFKYYNDDDENQQAVNAAKQELIKHDSDALSFLHIFKSWIENEYSSSWCDEYHIDMDVLNEVKIKVDEVCQHVYDNLNETILQSFSENDDPSSSILEMLFQCFSDNLCAFTGHYRTGYKILSSRYTAFLHPSSMLCSKENFPQFIIFNKMSCTDKKFLFNITAIPHNMVLTSLTNNTLELDYSDVFERTVVSKVIEPVNENIIKYLQNKTNHLLEIENHVKRELKTELIVIEPCLEKRCIFVYALEPILNSAVSVLTNILKNNLDNLVNAEQIYILELKKSGIIVPVEVKCVVGPKVIYAKMVSNLNKSDCVHRGIKSIEEKSAKYNSSSLQCSINLTWVRRPCSGTCYANFSPADFMQASKLSDKKFSILGSEVYVKVSRKTKNQLLISNVPLETRCIDIGSALKKLLPEVEDINVELKCSPPFKTTERDIEKIKMEIQENCELYTELVDFEVIVPEQEDIDLLMTAHINVFDMEDLSSAAESLSNTIINNFKVTATPEYHSIIKCSLSIYHALELHLKEKLNEFKSYLYDTYPTEDPFRFEESTITEDTILLKILSNDIHTVIQLEKIIRDLLDGEVLDNNIKNIHKLFSHGGYLYLRKLEKSHSVYILSECYSKVIRIYGLPQNCLDVKECIFRFLEDSKNEAIETITLSRYKNNRMFLKTIIKEYGVNLEHFVELFELQSAVLDMKSCHLILCGSREGINKAKETLNLLSSNMTLTAEYSSSGEMCPVCACPALNQPFQLQQCNHVYCRQCILSLVEQAHFPLQCCAQECTAGIILDDIVRIFEDPERMKKLLHSSLNEYLEKNKSKIFFCPTPSCSMFFYKNDVCGKLKCPLCQNDICASCNILYHHGFTCDMYQISKKDLDSSFKNWKKEITESKECPKCKTVIEKNTSSDHLICISCKLYFCWYCLREFSSIREVYNHIPFCDEYSKW